MAERVTGRLPEGWTKATTRKGLPLQAYIKPTGKSAVTFIGNLLEEGGSRFTTKARETKADKEQQITREGLRVSFDGPINESAATADWRSAAAYDYSFEPRNSDVVGLIEYDSKRMLLRVTYSNNGAVVVYFRVPASVYARFEYCENSGGEGNFSIGANIWNMLRQYDRGSLKVGGPYYPKTSTFVQRGGKVGFVYESTGASMDTGARQRAAEERARNAQILSDQKLKDLETSSEALLAALRDGSVSEEQLSNKKLIENIQSWIASGRLTREQIEEAYRQGTQARSERAPEKEVYELEGQHLHGAEAHYGYVQKGARTGETKAIDPYVSVVQSIAQQRRRERERQERKEK
jgi:hypothetical protein